MPEEKKKGFDLSDKLKGVSKLNIGLQEQPQLEYIDIDLIDPDPRNRKVEGIPELAQNIALVGLQQPLAVRANPDAEGRYMAISGHRRRLAIKQLVEEGEEKFRAVPCLVAPPGMSDAMVRLMILSGNMVTQGLTSAQMADATKEMEDAIYQLKEEGHEFPGKVRDYVGKACGIAGSRVTRLKAIRNKLSPSWSRWFDSGELAESTAYELAKMTKEDQEDWYQYQASKDPNVANIATWKVTELLTTLAKAKDKECPSEDCETCVRLDERHHEALRDGLPCSGCCMSCWKRSSCDRICPAGKTFVERVKAEEEKRRSQEEERARRETESQAAAEPDNDPESSLDCLPDKTDEPVDGTGKWVYLDWIPPHKKPDAEVLVALRFEWEKGKNYVSLGMWFNEKWCTRAGTPLEAEVTGWFPLPWTAENEEDPEE